MANLLSNTTIGGYQSIHTGNIGSYALTSTPALQAVSAAGSTTTNAITVGGLTVNNSFQVNITGVASGWSKLSYTASTAWGDATAYGVLGASGGNESGVMTYNQHAVWAGTSSGAGIRMGRSGGVSSGAWYQVATMASDEFMIAKNGSWSNGGLKITSDGILRYGSTGYRYVWENGTWAIGISGNAATATTASALTSMNISQFTNNSGYITSSFYSWTNPNFGQVGTKSNIVDNVLYSAADRFEVFKDGVAWNTNSPFNLNYDQTVDVIAVNTSRTYSIIFNTKGNGSSGITYTEGTVYLSFYYVYIPGSVSGRVRDQSGTWRNITGWTNVSSSGSYAVWRGNVPGFNYMVEMEITITANASNNTWFTQWEYVMGRPGQFELGIINKAQDNSVWRNLYFRNSSNTIGVTINSGGISASSITSTNFTVNNAIYFGGGNNYLNWTNSRIYSNVGIETAGNLVVGGNLGIGTANPSTAFEVSSSANGTTMTITSDGANEQFRIRRYSDNNKQLIIGYHSSNFATIQAVEQGVGYRNLILEPYGGNVGIGTTSPGDKLEVSGNVYANAFNAIGTLARYNSTGGIAIAGLAGTGYAYISAYSNSGGTGKDLALQKDGGNVGIGTTSPSEKLEVNGSIRLSDGNADGPQLKLASAGYSDWNIDNYNGSLRAYYGSTEYTRLTSSGNFGIGTDQPVGQLNVFGGTGNNPAILTLQSQSGGGGNTGIYFRPYQNITFANTAPAQATILAVDASYSAHITFSTKVPGAGTNSLVERMRLTSTGSLVIGSTSSTGEALQVTGSIKSTALSTNGPVVSSGGVLTSVNGYTGMVTIQQPVPMPPITFDIQNGIIVNVM